jgi:hypothetical protein
VYFHEENELESFLRVRGRSLRRGSWVLSGMEKLQLWKEIDFRYTNLGHAGR